MQYLSYASLTLSLLYLYLLFKELKIEARSNTMILKATIAATLAVLSIFQNRETSTYIWGMLVILNLLPLLANKNQDVDTLHYKINIDETMSYADEFEDWKYVLYISILDELYVILPYSKTDKLSSENKGNLVLYDPNKVELPVFEINNDVITCINYPAEYGKLTPQQFLSKARSLKRKVTKNDQRLFSYLNNQSGSK